MRNNLSILLLSFLAIFMFTSCEDKQEFFEGPYLLRITGSTNVVPESTVNYSLGNVKEPESYTWKVEEGPATIVGPASGATVAVKFSNVGDVILSVTNGTDAGRKYITAAETKASVTAVLDTTATGVTKALSAGQSDTVFFKFAVPVEGKPMLSLLTEDDSTGFNRGNPFISGSIGELQKLTDKMFYAIYTAGEGNGTPEAVLKNITSTAPYGSVKIDSSVVQLYRVDNIAPVVTVSYSKSRVNSGAVVTVTATFSEQVMFEDASNPNMAITLNGAGITRRDKLETTANPLVYSYEYEVPENATNGEIEVGLEGIVDYAGNELAGVSYMSDLIVDNINPVVTGTATDAGNSASIMISSTEAGTGMYKVFEAGSTVPTPTTPTTFMAASGVSSGSLQLSQGRAKTVAVALAKGNYVVAFLAMDEAGNYSTVETKTLVMD